MYVCSIRIAEGRLIIVPIPAPVKIRFKVNPTPGTHGAGMGSTSASTSTSTASAVGMGKGKRVASASFGGKAKHARIGMFSSSPTCYTYVLYVSIASRSDQYQPGRSTKG